MSNFSRRLPPLSTLVVFEAAFRHHSFSRAADEIALSQASVSRQIRHLETSVGVSLFERRRHDVVPTAEGEILASVVRVALGELATTAERLRTIGAGDNALTIYSDISIASILIAPVLGEFQQRFPDTRLKVLSSYEPIESTTDDFDIGFQARPGAEDRFIVESIADDLIFPVCSPRFARQLPDPVTAVDIASQPLLHLVIDGDGWVDWRQFLAAFRVKEPKPIEGLVFSSYQVCLEMAERGHGIALGWARSVKSRIDEGKLVRIPGMEMPAPDSIFVYRPRHGRPRPVVEALIETLRDSIVPVDELLGRQ